MVILKGKIEHALLNVRKAISASFVRFFDFRVLRSLGIRSFNVHRVFNRLDVTALNLSKHFLRILLASCDFNHYIVTRDVMMMMTLTMKQTDK